MSATIICNYLKKKRFKNLHDEKRLQKEMFRSFNLDADQLVEGGEKTIAIFQQEYRLDDNNIIDFLVDNIGIEVKIGGSKRAIYSQLERYAEFENVHEIILYTNVSMGLPETINGKPAYLVKTSAAWL